MSYMIIEENNFDKARKVIRENNKEDLVFTSNNDELNRKILEKEKISILLIKQKGRKDRQKQRDSGLNTVMAKLSKKNNCQIGIFLDEIINTNGKEKAEIISRVKQNIKICIKERLKMKFVSNNTRNKYDLKSLGLSLGMPTWMIKDL
jgi:RNase P/RNase MRP subunit p30